MLRHGSVSRPRSNRRGRRTLRRIPLTDRRGQEQPKKPAEDAHRCASGFAEHWLLATVGAVVLIAALVGGLLYWLEVRHYESTDDAFVAARSFSVASKVGGYVTDIPVTDNQHVNAGDLLAKIDERDYRIAIEQAAAQVAVSKANIANVEAQIVSQQEQIKQTQAQLEQAQAQLQFSQEEFARAQDLVEKGAGTVQRQQQTRSDLQAAAGQYRARKDSGDRRASRHQDAAGAARRARKAQLDQSQIAARSGEPEPAIHQRCRCAVPAVSPSSRAPKGTLVTAGAEPDDVRAR